MDTVTFLLGFMLLLWLLHLWGRSRLIGAWTGILLLMVSMWLLSNPAIIPSGEVVTYTYDQNGLITQEVHTTTFSTTPEVWPGVGLTLAKLLGFGLVPVALYMIFWNVLHPRP